MSLLHEIVEKRHLKDLKKLVNSYQSEFPGTMKLHPHEFIRQVESTLGTGSPHFVIQYTDKFGEMVPTGFLSASNSLKEGVGNAHMVYVLPAVREKGHGKMLAEGAKGLLGFKSLEGIPTGMHAERSRRILK